MLSGFIWDNQLLLLLFFGVICPRSLFGSLGLLIQWACSPSPP